MLYFRTHKLWEINNPALNVFGGGEYLRWRGVEVPLFSSTLFHIDYENKKGIQRLILLDILDVLDILKNHNNSKITLQFRRDSDMEYELVRVVELHLISGEFDSFFELVCSNGETRTVSSTCFDPEGFTANADMPKVRLWPRESAND